jgi:hypothetical protein
VIRQTRPSRDAAYSVHQWLFAGARRPLSAITICFYSKKHLLAPIGTIKFNRYYNTTRDNAR